MGEITIDFSEPPIQSLMDYVFKNFCELDASCKVQGVPVSVGECVDCCGRSYFGGNSEYHCDNFKKVYLVKYLAVQVAQVDLPIKVHLLHRIESKPELSAVSLGGGPGTEAIALMDELRFCDEDFVLIFDNIEREASWATICDDLTQRFAEKIKNVKLKARFIPLDVVLASYDLDRLYDIVFVSWMLSQVEEQDRSRVLEMARSLAEPEGYILVIDRIEPAIVEDISSTLSGIDGLNLIKKEGEVRGHCGVTFPPDIKDIFQVRIFCRATYWLLQRV